MNNKGGEVFLVNSFDASLLLSQCSLVVVLLLDYAGCWYGPIGHSAHSLMSAHGMDDSRQHHRRGGALDRVWRRGSKDPDIPVAV
jgi:hypothetical protein